MSIEGLSVIIPVFNCKKYLESCIASIMAVNDYCRTVLIREIILVDDGSTDGSSELCDKLALIEGSEDCVIRVIHQTNKGVSAARNTGLQAATGSFILFVDSDDSVDSLKLGKLIQMITNHGSVDMVVFGMTFDYYSQNRIYRQDLMCPPIEGTITYDECIAKLYNLFEQNMISSLCNKLIRKSVIVNAGICLREDMFLYEDLEFSLHLLSQCERILFCAEPIYHYRQAPDEGNAGRRLKRIAHIPEIIDKVEDALIPYDNGADILLPLYLVLAREKISCASKEEADVVCDDFRQWIDQHNMKSKITNKKQAVLLYNGKTNRLIFLRNKSRIRHRLANFVKQNVCDFRKWKLMR